MEISGDILGDIVTDIYWVEARDAAQHPTMHRAAPHKTKMIWLQKSIVLRLRKPELYIKMEVEIINITFSLKEVGLHNLHFSLT